ncbi:hypothetical protein RS9917_04630 [Synechococcus sp. RS9917]|nr:hypothetical protein RS9917_04630 [Synechococcus sp. RS9917]
MFYEFSFMLVMSPLLSIFSTFPHFYFLFAAFLLVFFYWKYLFWHILFTTT